MNAMELPTVRALDAADEGSTLKAAGSGCFISLLESRCRKFEVFGPEDVAIDPLTGLAYISSQSRRRGLGERSSSGPRGAIFALDLNGVCSATDPQAAPINLTDNIPFIADFHPLGIDLFVAEDGSARLFVINRALGGSRVEVFDVNRNTAELRHVRTIGPDSALTDPNDIAALSLDEFYLTNEHASETPSRILMEEVFGLRGGSVVYGVVSGQGPWTLKVVAKGFSLLSGIAVDSATVPPTVYVAPFWANKVFIYQADATGELTRTDAEIDLPGGADNLTLDKRGSMWIGACPEPRAAMGYFAGWRDVAPSLVLRIPNPKAQNPVVERIFVDDGTLISAASVAACYEREGLRRLTIGAPWHDRLLVVDLN